MAERLTIRFSADEKSSVMNGRRQRKSGSAKRPRRDAVDIILEQWHKEKPHLDVSAMGVIGRISRLERKIDARLTATFRRFGLERWTFDVLAALRRSGHPYRLTPTELFKSLMLTSGAMTHRIDTLETMGFVARFPDPRDRRGTLVGLTPKGRNLIDEAIVAHVENEQEMLKMLTAKERQQLAQLLKSTLRGLED